MTRFANRLRRRRPIGAQRSLIVTRATYWPARRRTCARQRPPLRRTAAAAAPTRAVGAASRSINAPLVSEAPLDLRRLSPAAAAKSINHFCGDTPPSAPSGPSKARAGAPVGRRPEWLGASGGRRRRLLAAGRQLATCRVESSRVELRCVALRCVELSCVASSLRRNAAQSQKRLKFARRRRQKVQGSQTAGERLIYAPAAQISRGKRRGVAIKLVYCRRDWRAPAAALPLGRLG